MPLKTRVREIAQVGSACTFVLGALLACGMTPAKTVASYKNPVFDGKAPGPTLVTTTVDCSKSAGESRPVAQDFQALLNKKIGQQQKAGVGFQSKEILCSTLATDKMLSPRVSDDEARSADFWKSRPAFGELTNNTGAQYGVKSLLVPIIVAEEACSRDTETMRDSQGRVIATTESSHVTCGPNGYLDVGVFLVSTEGVILWKSSGVLMGNGDHTKELEQLLATMPSASADGSGDAPAADATDTKADDQVAMKETSTQKDPDAKAIKGAAKDPDAKAVKGTAKANVSALTTAPKGTADDAAVDFTSVLANMDSKAPADCKTFAKTSCDRSKGSIATRQAICKGYVDAVNVVSKQSTSKQTCSAMLKNVPKN
jgi:hypothetical protein